MAATKSRWQALPTEAINPASLNIDKLDAGGIVDLMLAEDRRMLTAVQKERDRIALGADMCAKALRKGGRIVFVGAAYIPLLWVSVILALVGGLLLLVALVLGIVTLASKKQGGKGLGTMWGWETAEAMLGTAGFRDVRRHVLPQDPMNVWFVSRKG